MEGVRQALQAGAGPNSDDGHSMTPLMYAVVGKQSKVVSLLLSWPGVDANAKDGENMNKTALARPPILLFFSSCWPSLDWS